MDSLNVYPKKGKMLLLSIISIIFVLLGCLFIIGSAAEESIPILVGGVLVTAFFGAIMLFFIKGLRNPNPVLVISTEGIIDRSTFVSPGLIPWEQIKSIGYTRLTGQLFLSIQTKDPKYVIDQTTGFKRFLNKINRSFSTGQVNIPVKNFAYNTEQLHDDIQAAWKENILKRSKEKTGS